MCCSQIRHFFATAGLLLAPLSCVTPVFAEDFSFRNEAVYLDFQIPGEGLYASVVPTSVNAAGEVAGWYTGALENVGFVRDFSGAITTVDPMGCVRAYVSDMNNHGAATVVCESGAQGYIRSSDGQLTMLACPGGLGLGASEPFGINNAGTATGMCDAVHGFVRSAGGTLTLFDVPGSRVTTGYSINAGGTVAGLYLDANRVQHAFVRHPNGMLTQFDLPGPLSLPYLGGANFHGVPIPLKINDGGAIAGTYKDSGGVSHGFIRSVLGKITSFDVTGAINTYAFDLNASGATAGWYDDANNLQHGFVRSRNGEITTFDVPGSIFTIATSINNRGVIAGAYLAVRGGSEIGFLRLP